MKNETVIRADALRKTYPRGREVVEALRGISCEVGAGEFVAVTGPSGSGKTTLLNLIGCLDKLSSGGLRVAGTDVATAEERDLTRIRREYVGFVFQHFALLPTLTVAENVALPALFARRHAGKRVDELLEVVGLSHRRAHRPQQLSGGEMQRVALARALINGPRLLLADEPTGNLDSATGASILNLLLELNRSGLTVLVVTHNPAVAAAAPRMLQLRDGQLAGATEG